MWTANYRARPLAGRILLTADHGAWAIVGRRQFALLEAGRPGQALLRDLERKGLVRTARNAEAIEGFLRKWTGPYFCGTTLHIVVATRRCNLSCSYCHASATGLSEPRQDLDEATAKRIADFILKTPASGLTIEFQGGEPLLNFPVIRDMIEYARGEAEKAGKDVSFAIVTNLTLMTPEILSYAKTRGISLCTSLDGRPDLHDRNRRFPSGKGTHATVRDNLAMAAGCGQDVGILTVLSSASLPRYREIVDMYVEMGRDELCVNPVQKLGAACANWDEVGIPDFDDFLSAYREILDETFDRLRNGSYIMDRMFLLALSKVSSGRDVSYMDFRSPCGAVIGQLVYDVDGSIYPCDESRTFPELKLGNVREHAYADILDSPASMRVVEASLHTDPLCGRCAYRPYCGLCPVLSYSETGSLQPAPPGDLRCRLSMFLFDYLFDKLISAPEEIGKIHAYERVKQAWLGAKGDGP